MKIFADDTTFFENRTDGLEFTGIGILILDADNSDEIINDALENLELDPDIHKPNCKKKDLRTLTEKYFHACEDSPNAHSHLSRSICNKLKANYQYSYTRNIPENRELAWERCLQYLAVLLPQTKEPIDFYIEQRASISVQKIKNTFKHVDAMIDMGNYDLYAIPKFYPQIKIHIVDKSCPGVQIVDFITWANNRNHFLKPDNTWLSRLTFSSSSIAGKLGDDIYQGGFTFKRGVRQGILDIYPNEVFPLEEFSGNEELVDLYNIVIIEVVKFVFEKHNINKNLYHIWEEFQKLREDIITYGGCLNSLTIEGVSTCYLRLFDMKPAYSDLQKSDVIAFKKLIKAKRLCGLTLRKDLINGMMTRQFLAKSLKISFEAME